MIQWPTDLPQRMLIDGYSGSFPDGRLRTNMERGPAKVRRATSVAVHPYAVSLHLSLDELARLMRFWREDTRGGVDPFLIPDQDFDNKPLMSTTFAELTTESDVPLVVTLWWRVRFGDEAPKYNKVGPETYRTNFNFLRHA